MLSNNPQKAVVSQCQINKIILHGFHFKCEQLAKN